MIVLDTNVLSALMRDGPDPIVIAWLDGLPPESVWTTAITVFEIRFGIEIVAGRRYEMTTQGIRGRHIFLDEASVMGTENAVMAAVLADGQTVIGNAACEPHVQDLCRMLVSLGARIEGIESNVLRIHGVESLRGGEWRETAVRSLEASRVAHPLPGPFRVRSRLRARARSRVLLRYILENAVYWKAYDVVDHCRFERS